MAMYTRFVGSDAIKNVRTNTVHTAVPLAYSQTYDYLSILTNHEEAERIVQLHSIVAVRCCDTK